MENHNRLVRPEKLDSQGETSEEKLAFDSLNENFEKFCAIAETCLVEKKTLLFDKYLKFFQKLSWSAECMSSEFLYAMKGVDFEKDMGMVR